MRPCQDALWLVHPQNALQIYVGSSVQTTTIEVPVVQLHLYLHLHCVPKIALYNYKHNFHKVFRALSQSYRQ